MSGCGLVLEFAKARAFSLHSVASQIAPNRPRMIANLVAFAVVACPRLRLIKAENSSKYDAF